MSNIKYNIIHFLKHNNLGHYKPIEKTRTLQPRTSHRPKLMCLENSSTHQDEDAPASLETINLLLRKLLPIGWGLLIASSRVLYHHSLAACGHLPAFIHEKNIWYKCTNEH